MIRYVFNNVQWDDGLGPGHVGTSHMIFAIFNKLINGYRFVGIADDYWYEMQGGHMHKKQLGMMWIY